MNSESKISSIEPWRTFLKKVFKVLSRNPDLPRTYIYDWACECLDSFHKKLDICEWHEGLHGFECLRFFDPCCETGKPCEHLSDNGCTIKSLSCKLWLCSTANSKLQRIIIDKSNTLRQTALDFIDFRFKIMTFFKECNIPLKQRATKEETFSKNSIPELSEEWDWINQDFPITNDIDISTFHIEAFAEKKES